MTRSTSPPVFPRPLPERETEVLRVILSVDDDRLTPLREQAASAVVTATCKCGCASIDLAVDRERYRPAELCSPVVSTTTNGLVGPPTRETEAYGLLIFLDEGWLSLLEIWWIDQPPEEFPAPAAFDAPHMDC